MLQAQDEQIRAQQGQISQLTEMVKTLAVASATAANAASSTAAPGASGTLPSGQEDSAGLGSLRVDADGIVKMDVDTGLRSTRAEGYIPSLPKLDFAHMRTRHEEITFWTAFREELTSWLCLLDDRFSEELQEAIESGVEVRQIALSKGKDKGNGKNGGKDQPKGDPKGKGKDKGNGKGGKKGEKHRRPSSAPPGKGGDKRKDGKCHYCGKPGHWARDCRKKAADEKAGLASATAASASASASATSPSEGNVPKASAPSTKGAGKIGKAALLLSALSSPVAGETLSESNFCLAASNFPVILVFVACCMLGCLIFRAIMCQGNLRQSCFACFCVVAVYAWSRFAFASQPQSVFHQCVLRGPPLGCPSSEPSSFQGPLLGCPVLALPAVSMGDC